MARPWKHPKTGIYYIRKRVPRDLVTVVGRSLEKRSLGTKDSGEARRLHAEALCILETRWRNLRAGLMRPSGKEIAALAGEFYRAIVRETEGGRWSPFASPFLAQVAADRAEKWNDPKANENFRAIFGERIDRHLSDMGIRLDPVYLPAFEVGVARAFRDAEIKSAAIVWEGDYSPDPAAARYPSMDQAFPTGLPAVRLVGDALRIDMQFAAYGDAAKLASSTRKRWGLALKHLGKSLGHDDLRRITAAEVSDWIAALRTGGRSERTIRDVHLSALKALMSWLVGERKLTENPVTGFRIKVPKTVVLRDKGLSDKEAADILAAALGSSSAKLGPKHTAARRWIPWLSAYTGARINELTQLRHQDVLDVSGITVLRITPEAGSVKTGRYRDVPIHSHLIEQGFLEFARRKTSGPMFYDPKPGGSAVTPPYKKLGERLARWVRASGALNDPGVDPFHGWRHRFKTIGRGADVPTDVLDAIQGHAPRTEGGAYGGFDVPTLKRGIERMPRYEPRLEK